MMALCIRTDVRMGTFSCTKYSVSTLLHVRTYVDEENKCVFKVETMTVLPDFPKCGSSLGL